MTRTHSRTSATRRAVLVAAVAALGVGGLRPATAAAADIGWVGCFEDVSAETGVPYECATIWAPRDHDEADGPKIPIALTRIPATDPDHRIGSILLNPGGPGGSGVEFVLGFGPFAAEVLGAEVTERFDLVGFDPRGIFRSRPLLCFDDFDRALASFPDSAFPLSPPQARNWVESMQTLWAACEDRGQQVANHMSTANVARDMELIRRRLGDPGLTFLGGSYGSYVGMTYANLYPDRVRAVVIDGILDPVAFANVEGEIPFSTRLRSDQGARATIEQWMAQCDDAGATCALAPDALARWDALVRAVRRAPVPFVDPFSGEPLEVSYEFLTGLILGALYDPFNAAPATAYLAGLEAAAGLAPDGLVTSRAAGTWSGWSPGHPPDPTYPNVVEGFPAVGCVDSNNPTGLGAFWRASADAERQYGEFARVWTWAGAPCANWPFTDDDRYQGPWDAATANPVLVIGNRWDPATRYEGALVVRDLLPNSALVTLDVPGHTSLGLSSCTGAVTGQYLLDPSIAHDVDGLVCPQEFELYPPAGPGVGASARIAPTTTPDTTLDPAIVPEVRDLLADPFATPGRR